MEGGELFNRIQERTAFNERGKLELCDIKERESYDFYFQRQQRLWRIFVLPWSSYMIWTLLTEILNQRIFSIPEKVHYT